MREILIVTKDNSPFEGLDDVFGEGFEFTIFNDRLSGIEAFKGKRFDLSFFDFDMLDPTSTSASKDQKETLTELKSYHPGAPIVVLTELETTGSTLDLVEHKADSYLQYPFSLDELKLLCDDILSLQRRDAELEYLRDQFWNPEFYHLVDSTSPNMIQVLEKIKSVAPTKSTVLLEGETGVGKSIMAQLIHQHSPRRTRQFIHVHCGAITESLLESELFGHEKGSFTGADKRKLGKFEMAHRGTIFLDEISTLTPAAQIKLLQVLQNGTFQRVGGETDVNVDIRVIAATNENLESLSQQGRFRKDLYFRLNVFPIEIPPLRDRAEDIPKMVEVMLKSLNLNNQKDIQGPQPEILKSLMTYSWPGNVRELENVIERAYILEKTNILTAESLPLELNQLDSSTAVVPLNTDLPLAEARSRMIENFERQYIKEVLEKTKGKISEAATICGVGARQLNKLMNKYQLDKRDFKMSSEPSSDSAPQKVGTASSSNLAKP